MSELRVGTGFDAHALDPGVPLVLGGVSFDSPRGLAGHSDGDVITHALIDALLGAAGLGDIGAMFPPDDPELKGVSSVKLLREAYVQVRRAGYELVNADVVFIGQEPRLAPVRPQMQETLGAALDLDDPARISVRALSMATDSSTCAWKYRRMISRTSISSGSRTE